MVTEPTTCTDALNAAAAEHRPQPQSPRSASPRTPHPLEMSAVVNVAGSSSSGHVDAASGSLTPTVSLNVEERTKIHSATPTASGEAFTPVKPGRVSRFTQSMSRLFAREKPPAKLVRMGSVAPPTGLADKPPDSWGRVLSFHTVALTMGIFFGIALAKGRVVEISTIRGQFVFDSFIMLKMFLSATATSTLVFLLTKFVSEERFNASRTYTCATTLRWPTVVAGSSMLGLGMQLAGSCPGMVLPQLGAAVGGGACFVTLAGGFVGALVYGLAQPHLPSDSHVLWRNGETVYTRTFDQLLSVRFEVLATVAFFALTAIVALMEVLWPWQTELSAHAQAHMTADTWFFQYGAWPPQIAGAMIGLLQLPATFLLGNKSLGTSSSYITLVAKCMPDSVLKDQSLLKTKKKGIDNWWQVTYVLGAVLGGGLAVLGSGEWGDVPAGSLWSLFLGGFFMIFGSRFGGGCTSYHGISGMGHLNANSVLACCCMFGAAIASGFVMKAAGLN